MHREKCEIFAEPLQSDSCVTIDNNVGTRCPTFDIDIGGQMSIDAPANGRMEGWMDRAVQKGKDYGTEGIGYWGISYGEITLYLPAHANHYSQLPGYEAICYVQKSILCSKLYLLRRRRQSLRLQGPLANFVDPSIYWQGLGKHFVDNAPSVGVLRCFKNPIDARD